MFDLIPFTSKYRAITVDSFRDWFDNKSGCVATDVRETENSFFIEAEMPGYEKSELHVSLKDDMLTISAAHKEETEETDANGNYIRRERSGGSCQRCFNVEGIDAAAITAEYVNGVLKLTLPKLPEVQPVQQEIEIL